MKTEITSLDLHFLVRELQELVGAKIDKVYEQDLDRKEFLFVFHKSGMGKIMLRIRLPSLAYLTDSKQVFPESPPGFCMFLRKHLGNARVLEIRQHGFERILEISFEAKEGVRKLICELFSKGNMILVDENNKIRGLLESQNWQSRTIRGGTEYEYPPSQGNVLSMDETQFSRALRSSGKDSIVKTLAVDLGFGGLYSEELCKAASLDKDEKDLSDENILRLYSEVRKLVSGIIDANSSGDEILPIVLKTAVPIQHYESFSKAIDTMLTGKLSTASEQKEAKEKKTRHDKISVVIEKQSERLKELEKGIAENQRKGELIYEHYIEIKELLQAINESRKKMDWSLLKEKYKDNTLLKDIDEKKGILYVEL